MTDDEKPLTLGDLVEPMPGKIAVMIDTRNEFTPGGLFIPVDTARTIHEARATQGVVVAHGDIDDDSDDDLESPPVRVNIGDTVLFGKYTGTKIIWQPDAGPDGIRPSRQEVIVMYEKDVLARLLSPEQAKNIKVKT